jgi:hypothetical protein
MFQTAARRSPGGPREGKQQRGPDTLCYAVKVGVLGTTVVCGGVLMHPHHCV